MFVEGEILHVSGQNDFDIYIIGSPLMCVPTTVIIPCTWMDLEAGEFSKILNIGETEFETQSWVPVRFWSKWLWHIDYWATSEAGCNPRNDRLDGDSARCQGIPSDAKFQLNITMYYRFSSSPFLVIVTLIYTLLGHIWCLLQPLWQSVGGGWL